MDPESVCACGTRCISHMDTVKLPPPPQVINAHKFRVDRFQIISLYAYWLCVSLKLRDTT